MSLAFSTTISRRYSAQLHMAPNCARLVLASSSTLCNRIDVYIRLVDPYKFSMERLQRGNALLRITGLVIVPWDRTCRRFKR
jgi:hypothetical protein